MSATKNIYNKILTYCRWFIKFGIFPFKRTAIVLGVPTHNNIGDLAITIAEEKYLYAQNYNRVVLVTITECWDYYACICKILRIQHSKQIFFHGGGNLGDLYDDEKLRRTIIPLLGERDIFILPQTIYYTDSEKGKKMLTGSVNIYNKSNIHIAAREKYSYDFIREIYPKAEVCLSPDIVLALGTQKFVKERSGILLCFRDDSEKNISTEAIMNLNNSIVEMGYPVFVTSMISKKYVISSEEWNHVVLEKMEEISNAKLLITDRLHGMIFAALTETPCIVLGNNHHKIRGVYEKWLSELEYLCFVNSVEEVISSVENLYSLENNHFEFNINNYDSLNRLIS